MNESQQKMADYYAKRAKEYERIYAKPERQNDLRRIEQVLTDKFKGKSLLEVACGTGYWTQFIAQSADAIFATDYNKEVIDVAKNKDYGNCHTNFAQADAYILDNVSNNYNAGFHGFWWSHIPTTKIDTFIKAFHAKLLNGSKVVMIDNIYVEGSSTPISRKDSDGNTYQIRKLDDGTKHEILKNFPLEQELQKRLSGFANNIDVCFLKYYWIVEYIKK